MIVGDIVNADNEEQYELAFGEHTGISSSFTRHIHEIKHNNPNVNLFVLSGDNTPRLSELAWELLGHYIANNAHLSVMKLVNCNLTDEKMLLLFQGLIRSDSIDAINFSSRWTAKEVTASPIVQSMSPFLQNSPQLSIITFANIGINSQGFESLIKALSGGPIEELVLCRCDITDISALNLSSVTLPHLKKITLNRNSIGREGIVELSNILQQERITLTKLHLHSTDIDDEDLEILANSLKRNTTLTNLCLTGNKITDIGYRTILKLLNDVSSIENTYNSNHTLLDLFLSNGASWNNNDTPTMKKINRHIESAIKLNRQYNDVQTGKAKVIQTQLNSANKMELAKVQGITYSYYSLFFEVDPVVLPEVLALVDGNCKHSELFRMATMLLLFDCLELV